MYLDNPKEFVQRIIEDIYLTEERLYNNKMGEITPLRLEPQSHSESRNIAVESEEDEEPSEENSKNIA